MPILNLQMTMRQLGRIRMGSQVPTQSGKMRPNKLETWRLTSKHADYLESAAALYGGTVTAWDGAPAGGDQWELFTESDTLEVTIPPGDMAFSQWMEMWSGGGCMRRCDQQMEQLSGEPCLCPTDTETRIELASKGQACKPTTRLSVIQPKLPDIGLWRLDAHGYYGAVELAGSIEILRSIQSVSGLVPARLRIDQRSVKRDGQTINYAVPTLELPTLTAHALMSGEVRQLEPVRPELASVPDSPGELPAAAPAPAQVRQTYKPRNPPDTQDGSSFLRLIRSAAKTKGLDDEQLEVVALEVCKKPVSECVDQKSANELLRAIKERPKAAVS